MIRPRKRRWLVLLGALAASIAVAMTISTQSNPDGPASPRCPLPSCGSLVWHDEFDPTRGGALDPKRWGHDVGATGWGNEELQEYTASRQNSFIAEDGTLRVVLRSTPGGAAPYTSARVVSRDRVSVGTGYVEARIKLPKAPASGVWPAFWLLAQGEEWPHGGEIDVLETVNGVNGYSTNIHGGPEHWQQYDWHETAEVNDGRWHTFGVLIRHDRLDFFHDRVLVSSVSPERVPAGGVWPFDVRERRYYLLFNVAMGGLYPGTPDGTAVLPASMHVDYVRYWGLGTGE